MAIVCISIKKYETFLVILCLHNSSAISTNSLDAVGLYSVMQHRTDNKKKKLLQGQ